MIGHFHNQIYTVIDAIKILAVTTTFGELLRDSYIYCWNKGCGRLRVVSTFSVWSPEERYVATESFSDGLCGGRNTHARAKVLVYACISLAHNTSPCDWWCDKRILADRREAIPVLDLAKSHHIRAKATKRDVQTLDWATKLSNDFHIICDCQLHSCCFWWVIKNGHD